MLHNISQNEQKLRPFRHAFTVFLYKSELYWCTYYNYYHLAIIKASPLYVIGAPLLSPCIPASLPSSLPPGSASPSPTRWPSLRVKAVFPAPLARQNVAVAEPVRTDLRQSRHTGESTYAHGESFFVRPSDFGKSRPLFIMEGRNVHVSTC